MIHAALFAWGIFCLAAVPFLWLTALFIHVRYLRKTVANTITITVMSLGAVLATGIPIAAIFGAIDWSPTLSVIRGIGGLVVLAPYAPALVPWLRSEHRV